MKILGRFTPKLEHQPNGLNKVEISFPLETFFGFSPLVGFNEILGVAVAILFCSNKIFSPYHIFSTWLGLLITGMPEGVTLSITFASISYPLRLYVMRHFPTEGRR